MATRKTQNKVASNPQLKISLNKKSKTPRQTQRKSTQLGFPNKKTNSKTKKSKKIIEDDDEPDDYNETRTERLQINDLDKLLSLKAGDAFEWLYGTKAQFEYIDIDPPSNKKRKNTETRMNKYENARAWWERTPATTQCANTVGKREKTKKCYICGLAINDNYIDENTPECEHILPVFLGSLLLTLYRSELKKNLSLQVKKELSMEYDWAHRCCNQIKKDASLIKFDKNKNNFVFNDDVCKEMLKKIKGSDASYCKGKITNAIEKTNKLLGNRWIETRLDFIQNERIKPICDYLNKSLKVNGSGIFYLSILASLISSADLRVINMAQDKSGYTNKRKNEINAKTKAQTNSPKIIQTTPFKESIVMASVFHSLTVDLATSIESLKTTIMNKPKSILSNQSQSDNQLQKRRRLLYGGKDTPIQKMLISNNTNSQISRQSPNEIRDIYKITATMIGKESLLSDRVDYNSTYKYILSCLILKTFIKRRPTNIAYDLQVLGFEYNYILRDLVSILFYTIYIPANINVNQDDYMEDLGLVVDVSTIATKIITICIFYINLDIVSSSSRADIQLKVDIINILNNILQEYKTKLISLTSSNQNLYNSVYFIINKIITAITGVENLSQILPNSLENIAPNESLLKLISQENVLYCRMEYYKKYSEQYMELINNIQDKFDNYEEEFKPTIDLYAANLLLEMKNGNKKIGGSNSNLLMLANSIKQHEQGNDAATKLLEIRNEKLTKQLEEEWVDSAEIFYKKTEDLFFKKDKEIKKEIYNNKLNILNSLKSMGI